MMRHKHLRHDFVRDIPEKLEPGVIYISMEYATAVHSCCCGCGTEIVTPFTPTDWNMTFNGETISLRPSIGNWNEPCRSHYVIECSRVIEACPWSDRQIKAEALRDAEAKREFYTDNSSSQEFISPPETATSPESTKVPVSKLKPSFWRRLFSFVSSK